MDHYLDSWWCALDAPDAMDWDARMPLNAGDDAGANDAGFLQPSDIAEGKQQFQKLAATGAAPNYLRAQTLAWAHAHTADPRLPEALAYVVRVGHYGCVDDESWKLSRDAHTLLHASYGKTTWARKTPYWFR